MSSRIARVLVTGAAGFIGRELCVSFKRAGYAVRAALRSRRTACDDAAEDVVVGDINATTDWQVALSDVDVVVHAAARAHVSNSGSGTELFFETNARGTERLALSAKAAGVRRLIYLSSVKVNGEATRARPYSSSDAPAPQDDYAVSKWVGERHVLELAASSQVQVAIVRAPLVYGCGVKANFLRLLQWVDKQRPLPFGAIDNKRSLVSLWNLCDLLVNLSHGSQPPNRVWMVSDGEDMSTPELIRRIGAIMGRHVRMLPVPVSVLRVLGRLAGRTAEVNRLCGSLAVDMDETRARLHWNPPITFDEGIARTVEWYLREGR